MKTIRIVALSVALVTGGAFSGEVSATTYHTNVFTWNHVTNATPVMVVNRLRERGVNLPEAELNALARRVAAAPPGTTVCTRDSAVCIRIER
jgi:hypothetical protein